MEPNKIGTSREARAAPLSRSRAQHVALPLRKRSPSATCCVPDPTDNHTTTAGIGNPERPPTGPERTHGRVRRLSNSGGVGRAGRSGRDTLGRGAQHRRLVLGKLVPGLVLAHFGGAPTTGADGEPSALPRNRAEVVAMGVLDGPAHLGAGQVRDDEFAGVAVEPDAP